jgi:predicted ribonuclease YlaK
MDEGGCPAVICRESLMLQNQGTDCHKLFVLDTNVIAIPIMVLEGLDQFKKGNQDIHFQAREFLRPHEVKTIITRAGEGTKIVFTGDIQQIDHAYLDSLSNGLSYLISRMVGHSLYAHVTLEKGERSELADLASVLL